MKTNAGLQNLVRLILLLFIFFCLSFLSQGCSSSVSQSCCYLRADPLPSSLTGVSADLRTPASVLHDCWWFWLFVRDISFLSHRLFYRASLNIGSSFAPKQNIWDRKAEPPKRKSLFNLLLEVTAVWFLFYSKGMLPCWLALLEFTQDRFEYRILIYGIFS